MTKKQEQEAERANARAKLLEWIKPGSEVFTVLRHVSKSGMSRSISLFISHEKTIFDVTYFAARAMGDTIDRNHGGIKISGYGMDMGFALVYNLGATLWPKGTPEPHGRRNGEPDSDGGYALKHHWL